MLSAFCSLAESGERGKRRGGKTQTEMREMERRGEGQTPSVHLGSKKKLLISMEGVSLDGWREGGMDRKGWAAGEEGVSL